jgi:hypothetical protein
MVQRYLFLAAIEKIISVSSRLCGEKKTKKNHGDTMTQRRKELKKR